MTKPKPKDQLIPPIRVTIRGVTYPTVAAAAKALKVKPNTIYVALHKGRIDKVGLGCGKVVAYRHPQIPPKPIKVGGLDFPSLQALSLWLGRSKQYASNKLKRHPDTGLTDLTQEVLAKRMTEGAARTRAAYEWRDRIMSEGIGRGRA